MTTTQKDFYYKNFIDLLLKQIKKSRIPKYLSKYSKKLYSIWQHLILQTFKSMLNSSYREFVTWLEQSKVIELLCIKTPHFTTLHKFSQRAKPIWLEGIIQAAIELTRKHKLVAVIDSTGFSIMQGSTYYCKRTITRYKRPWIKLSIIADAKAQLVLGHKISMYPRNDIKDFLPLLKKIRHVSISSVCADKAYDSNENHRFVLRELKAKSRIALKDYGTRRTNRNNFYIKLAMREFNEKEYHKRSLAETIFSVIKRLFGSVLRARLFYMRVREILFKVIAYNTRRLSKIIFVYIEDFYRAMF